MNDEYESIKKFWDGVFKKKEITNPAIPISNKQIEKLIEWISKDSNKILDFGCGSGRVLLKSLSYGVEHVYGIDISEKAIKCALNTVKEYGLEEKVIFKTGSIEKLKEIESKSFDGAILFNIVDNLIPQDARKVLEEIHRIVKEKGKILIKFNSYIKKELIEEYEFEEVEEELYKESSGLYLWNLTDEKIRQLLKPYFELEEEIVVEFPEHNQINRMYYTRNKQSEIK